MDMRLALIGFLFALGCAKPAPLPEPPIMEAMGSLLQPGPDLPPPERILTRIAIGSCADQRRPMPIWSAIAESEPEVFLFIGDNVYGDVAPGDDSLVNLRRAYAGLAMNPDFGSFAARFPILPIWDDHDYGANDGGDEFQYRAESEALFRRFWHLAEDDSHRSESGLYGAWSFGPEGQRVQVILLDTRSFRGGLTPRPPGPRRPPGRYVPSMAPGQRMLGAAQWTWLDEQLRKPADLRLVVSSIQVLPMDHGWERWGQLPAERQRFLDLLDETDAKGVVLLSGDRHWASMYEEASGDVPLLEVTTSSLNRPSRRRFTEAGPLQVEHPYVQENFGLITIDWIGQTARFAVHDIVGAVVMEREMSFSAPLPQHDSPVQDG